MSVRVLRRVVKEISVAYLDAFPKPSSNTPRFIIDPLPQNQIT